MSELFGNTSTPQWLNPAEFSLKSEQAASSIGQTFGSAFNAAANRAQQAQQFKQMVGASQSGKKPVQADDVTQGNEKVASAPAESGDGPGLQEVLKNMIGNPVGQGAGNLADAFSLLNGATTSQAALGVIGEHPQVLANPATAPLVNNYLQNLAQVDVTRNNALRGQLAIKDSNEFFSRISALPPEDRAAIQSLDGSKNGAISPSQWQALNLAEQNRQTAAQSGGTASVPSKLPEVGAVYKGHRFLGGSPADEGNWRAMP